jgi:hypothetical protein
MMTPEELSEKEEDVKEACEFVKTTPKLKSKQEIQSFISEVSPEIGYTESEPTEEEPEICIIKTPTPKLKSKEEI